MFIHSFNSCMYLICKYSPIVILWTRKYSDNVNIALIKYSKYSNNVNIALVILWTH